MTKKIIAVILMVFLCVGVMQQDVGAKPGDNAYGEPFRIRCTVYYPTGNPCSNGRYPVEGLTVAGMKEWEGMACVMYECLPDGSRGDLIGVYEFTDTGFGLSIPDSDRGTIQEGLSIDRFCENEISGNAWIAQYGDYVYIQVIDAKG